VIACPAPRSACSHRRLRRTTGRAPRALCPGPHATVTPHATITNSGLALTATFRVNPRRSRYNSHFFRGLRTLDLSCSFFRPSRPFFSIGCALFDKNTRGGGTPFSALSTRALCFPKRFDRGSSCAVACPDVVGVANPLRPTSSAAHEFGLVPSYFAAFNRFCTSSPIVAVPTSRLHCYFDQEAPL
jgi:hypothetical protein